MVLGKNCCGRERDDDDDDDDGWRGGGVAGNAGIGFETMRSREWLNFSHWRAFGANARRRGVPHHTKKPTTNVYQGSQRRVSPS